ncbi:hypothetical protein RHIZ404_230416 [Rhizobium sp. EC-SD404]|nr:hypothetical protein RHIZ404_230416 [Rhizobium sp. EC-SD404]
MRTAMQALALPSDTNLAQLARPMFSRHHRPMTDLVLKWRRTYRDDDQHFRALDSRPSARLPSSTSSGIRAAADCRLTGTGS